MKFLHIMPDSIYSKDYLNRINKLYNQKEHFFLIYNYNTDRKYDGKNCLVIKELSFSLMFKLIGWILKSEKVILHSLYIDKKMHIIFAILSCFMQNKFMWYVWSADLYNEHEAEMKITGLRLQKRIKRLTRRILISHLKAIIVVAEGDYICTKKWYKTKAVMLQAEYGYDLIEKELDDKCDEGEYINILAGHNASPSRMHKELFDRLSFCRGRKVRIISILSYPDNDIEYKRKVLQLGERMFGKNFVPIVDWMPYEKYIDLLNSIDIALFEGDIQMGAGNIFNLIYLGKKVYLSENNSIYQQLKKNEIICFSKEMLLLENIYTELTMEEKKSNRKRIIELLSDDVFKEKWDKVFELV